MATCYRCGRPILSSDFKLRRKVKTGERISRRYPNPQISSQSITYGVRLVCSRCARSLDAEEARREWLHYLELAGALLLLAVVLFTRYFL